MKKKFRSLLSVLCLAVLLVNLMPVYAGATEATATPAPTAAAAETAAEATATPVPEEYVAPSSWTALMMYSSEKGDWEIYEATEGVNTCEFLGDGIYEITLKGADIAATAKAETPQVFLIDIPGFVDALKAQNKNFQNYTDVGTAHDVAKHGQPTDLDIKLKVFVDGAEVRCKSDLLNYGDIEEKGTFRIEIFNKWGLHAAAITENPPVIAEAICPETEIKVQFTITGTGYNTEAGAAAIAAANPTPTTAPVAAETTDTTTTTTGTDTADAAATSADAEDGGLSTGLIIGIVAAVVVVAVIVVVLVMSRKKKK